MPRILVATLASVLLALAVAQKVTVTVDVVDAANPDTVLGTVTLTDGEQGGLLATLEIGANEAIPGGEHAIHLHENADCGPADVDGDGAEDPAGAAGEHYNPTGVGHGEDDGPHVGDSENYNYTFQDDGQFFGEVVFPEATMEGEASVLAGGGTALVIHQGTDDMETNPDGNSGPRIACAELTPADAEGPGAEGMGD